MGFEVLLRVRSGGLRIADACELIGLHRRQVFRLLRGLKQDGAASLLSKRRLVPHANLNFIKSGLASGNEPLLPAQGKMGDLLASRWLLCADERTRSRGRGAPVAVGASSTG